MHQWFKTCSPSPLLKFRSPSIPFLLLSSSCILRPHFVLLSYCFFFFFSTARWILALLGDFQQILVPLFFLLHFYANWNANMAVPFLSLWFKEKLRGWQCIDNHGSPLRNRQSRGGEGPGLNSCQCKGRQICFLSSWLNNISHCSIFFFVFVHCKLEKRAFKKRPTVRAELEQKALLTVGVLFGECTPAKISSVAEKHMTGFFFLWTE